MQLLNKYHHSNILVFLKIDNLIWQLKISRPEIQVWALDFFFCFSVRISMLHQETSSFLIGIEFQFLFLVMFEIWYFIISLQISTLDYYKRMLDRTLNEHFFCSHYANVNMCKSDLKRCSSQYSIGAIDGCCVKFHEFTSSFWSYSFFCLK